MWPVRSNSSAMSHYRRCLFCSFASAEDICGVLLQYPNTVGSCDDLSAVTEAAHEGGAYVVVASDLLALTVLKTPSSWGADIVVGSAQVINIIGD